MNLADFKGTFTALPTPFYNGDICHDSLRQLVEHQLVNAVDGVVLLGTTGEAPTISWPEQVEIIERVVAQVRERIPVMVGATSNSTPHAVHLACQAREAGADAVLAAAPYYNKPSAEGLYHHFAEMARISKIPILLYSIPSRCGIEIPVEVVCRLKEHFSNIIGIKEASGSCERVYQLRAALGDEIVIMSGDDAYTLPFMSLGAEGVVSVASNVIPEKISEIVGRARENNFKSATELNASIYEFIKCLFIETNPVPVKYVLHKMGIIRSPEVRQPLWKLTTASMERIDRVLEAMRMRVYA